MLVVLVVMGRLHLPGPEHDVLGLNTGPVVAGYLKDQTKGGHNMKLYAVVSFIHAFMSVDFHGIEKTKFHVHNGPNNSK